MSASRAVPVVVRKGLDLWHRVEVWIAVLTFSAIAIILMYDVAVREMIVPLLAKLGIDAKWLVIYGSQKIGVYLLVFAAFTGIGIATWTGAQLVPKLGHRAVPAHWDEAADRLADLVTFLFLVAATVIAAMFVVESYEAGQRGSGGIRIEMWKIQIAIPLGLGSAAVRYLAFVIWPGLRPAAGENLE